MNWSGMLEHKDEWFYVFKEYFLFCMNHWKKLPHQQNLTANEKEMKSKQKYLGFE